MRIKCCECCHQNGLLGQMRAPAVAKSHIFNRWRISCLSQNDTIPNIDETGGNEALVFEEACAVISCAVMNPLAHPGHGYR